MKFRLKGQGKKGDAGVAFSLRKEGKEEKIRHRRRNEKEMDREKRREDEGNKRRKKRMKGKKR